MKNYMKTILNGVLNWTKNEIKDSVADWNQNDSKASNYVKDRTHYEEIKLHSIFNDIISIYYNDYYGYLTDNLTFFATSLDKEYIVEFDGVRYNTEVFNTSWMGDQYTAISFVLNNGIIATLYDSNFIHYSDAMEERNYNFILYEKEAIVHQIDPKYIPALIVNISGNEEDGFISDKTSTEIYEVYKNGLGVAAKAWDTAWYTLGWCDKGTACFMYVYGEEGYHYTDTFRIYDDGSVEYFWDEGNGFVSDQIFIVTQESSNEYDDLAWEIYQAKEEGKIVIYKNGDEIYTLTHAEFDPNHNATFVRITSDYINTIYIENSNISYYYKEIPKDTFIVTYDSINEYDDLGKAIYDASREGRVVVFQSGDWFYNLTYSEIEPSHAATFTCADWNGDINSIHVHYSEITNERFDTVNYVDTSIASLVDSAPETLNTLNELATALQDNQDLTTTLNQAIGEKATLEDLNNHKNNTEVHITAAEREKWSESDIYILDTLDKFWDIVQTSDKPIYVKDLGTYNIGLPCPILLLHTNTLGDTEEWQGHALDGSIVSFTMHPYHGFNCSIIIPLSISAPIVAEVGQTIIVKSIDENGKPTEWEAIDPWVLTDDTTNIKYKIGITNGKVTLTEVSG